MDHKYVLKKKGDQLIIHEMSATEPGKFALLFEEKLSFESVESALAQGKAAVIDLFRSHNFYPQSVFADRLADKIEAFFSDEAQEALTMAFNDNEALLSHVAEVEVVVDEKELVEIDKLLEDGEDGEDKEDDFEA